MRNDLGRAQRRWSKRRDIFAERRTRRFPWKGVLLALTLAVAALALAGSDLDGLLDGLTSLFPDSASGTAPATDPDRLPLLPLPPPPAGR